MIEARCMPVSPRAATWIVSAPVSARPAAVVRASASMRASSPGWAVRVHRREDQRPRRAASGDAGDRGRAALGRLGTARHDDQVQHARTGSDVSLARAARSRERPGPRPPGPPPAAWASASASSARAASALAASARAHSDASWRSISGTEWATGSAAAAAADFAPAPAAALAGPATFRFFATVCRPVPSVRPQPPGPTCRRRSPGSGAPACRPRP